MPDEGCILADVTKSCFGFSAVINLWSIQPKQLMVTTAVTDTGHRKCYHPVHVVISELAIDLFHNVMKNN